MGTPCNSGAEGSGALLGLQGPPSFPLPSVYLQERGVGGIQLGVTLHLWGRGTISAPWGALSLAGDARGCQHQPMALHGCVGALACAGSCWGACGQAGSVPVCPHSQLCVLEHIWDCEEGEVSHGGGNQGGNHAQMPTQADRFAREDAPAQGSSGSEQDHAYTWAPSACRPGGPAHHSPPPLQRARCLRPPASQGSCKWEEGVAQ